MPQFEVSPTTPAATAVAEPAFTPVRFHGGLAGALAPFFLYLLGIAWLAFSGAPDERGFWPMVLAGLALGLILATDRQAYSEVLIQGMSQPITAIMVMAWLLAGVLGAIMAASGFIEALIWLARELGLTGGAFVGATFLICSLVSTSTGTSFGTIFLAGPLLYPAGGPLGADPAVLIGAIIGGATFGDNISPISDTTIASALSQRADIGGVVRSRLKYAIPAAALALVAYVSLGASSRVVTESSLPDAAIGPRGFPMLIAPALVIALLLAKRHLIHGLLFGILAAIAVGLGFGLITLSQLVYIDPESYRAQGIILDGLEHGIGISILTFLLMGLVAALQSSGVVGRVVAFARERSKTPARAEWWIFGSVTAAGLMTMHSVVAIVTVGEFTRETGGRAGIGAYRRANILDVTMCSWPFLVPYFIPAILAAGTTASAEAFGMPRVSPFDTAMHNFHSWALLAMMIFAIATGYGRTFLRDEDRRQEVESSSRSQ